MCNCRNASRVFLALLHLLQPPDRRDRRTASGAIAKLVDLRLGRRRIVPQRIGYRDSLSR